MKIKSLTIQTGALTAVFCLFLAAGLATSRAAVTVAEPTDTDRQVSDHIKTAVRGDQNLSFQGRDIKITPANGEVVLQGHVASITERRYIMAKARSVAGHEKVINKLDASPEKTLP